MSNLVRMLEACVIVKFNFFPWGQLESLSLDKFKIGRASCRERV